MVFWRKQGDEGKTTPITPTVLSKIGNLIPKLQPLAG